MRAICRHLSPAGPPIAHVTGPYSTRICHLQVVVSQDANHTPEEKIVDKTDAAQDRLQQITITWEANVIESQKIWGGCEGQELELLTLIQWKD